MPFGVSPESLWRTPDAWKDQPIHCLLISESYRTDAAFVLWYDGSPGQPPAVVFECIEELSDNRASIEITGTCRGRVDGRILVTDCKIMTIRRRLP